MIKQFFRLTVGVALAAATMGCDAYSLDAVQPIDSVPLNLAVTDANSAGAARAGVYDALQDGDLTFDGYVASYTYFSDDTDWTGTFPTRAQFDNYNVLPSNGTMGSMWAGYYTVINTANNLIDVLPGVEDPSLTDEIRNSLLAEARFGRAIAYFHLVTGWGGVPLILTPTTSVGEELNVPASSADEIYQQVIDDATFAVENLGSGSLGMNAAGANALLARVAMMQGNYSAAGTYATAAIGADYDLTAVPFLADEIFYLKFSSTDGQSNAFFFGPDGLGGRYSIAPSQMLYDAFEEGDTRRALSIDTLGGQLYGLKYDNFSGAAGSQDDPIYFFRAAEQVLILAEVAAREGDFDTAEMWINQVRSRAGLDDIEDMDDSNYLDYILQERYVELAMEGGFRLWDLRRTGRAVEVLGAAGYDPCDAVWPYPQSNIDTNTALEQNDCCNC